VTPDLDAAQATAQSLRDVEPAKETLEQASLKGEMADNQPGVYVLADSLQIGLDTTCAIPLSQRCSMDATTDDARTMSSGSRDSEDTPLPAIRSASSSRARRPI